MPKSAKQFIIRRSHQDVFGELVTGLQRLVLTNDVKLGDKIGRGGYADVYTGTIKYVRPSGRKKYAVEKVAVKVFRVLSSSEKDFMKSFKRELCIWARLQHKNVLSLIGVVTVDSMPGLVSEWMENGTMVDYLKKHEGIDVREVVCGIACGLEFLHDMGVVHSDLKGDNILMANDGRPVLSDFGISRLLVNSVTIAGTTTLKGSMRWLAPELMIPTDGAELKHSCHTRATDVWAFGMVAYEAFSGEVPYCTIQKDAQVVMSVINRQCPSKPENARASGKDFDVLWQCCSACWSFDPADRPTMARVRASLTVGELVERTLTVEAVSNVSAGMCWMSPTGRSLAIRSGDWRSISFYDSKSMNRRGPNLSLDFGVSSIAWSSIEDNIVIRSDDGVLYKWGNVFEIPVFVAQSTQKHEYASLEFSPDDRFVASFYGSAKLWDASDLSLIWEYPGGWPSVAFHPLGSGLFFHGGYSLLNVEIDELGSVTAMERQINYDVHDLVFGPGENTCLTGTDEGVKILSTDTFAEKSSLPYRDCKAMQVTPNGQYVLLVLWSKRVVLWDVAAEKAVEDLALDVHSFTTAEISRNCRLLRLRNDGDEQLVHLASMYY